MISIVLVLGGPSRHLGDMARIGVDVKGSLSVSPDGRLSWRLARVGIVAALWLTLWPGGAMALPVDGGARLTQGSELVDGMPERAFAVVIDALGPQATQVPGSLPYTAEKVSFRGGADDVTLAGTLTLPGRPGPHAVIVLMSGSGPQDRDESLGNAARIKPFALIADALTRAGVGVLRYDDRGVAASSGDYVDAVIRDFAADGAAAIDYVSSRNDIDAGHIGILGHGEGGLYVASIAARDSRVAFVVGMAAPAVAGLEFMVEQNVALARVGGTPVDEQEHLRIFVEAAYAAVLAEDTEALEAAIREAFGAYWDRLTLERRSAVPEREAFVDLQVAAQVSALSSRWFRSILESDAGADWARVSVPVLGLYGGRDVQLAAARNAEALREALGLGGNEDHEIIVFPDANHLFQAAETGDVAEYATLGTDFTPDFLPMLVNWVVEHSGVST